MSLNDYRSAFLHISDRDNVTFVRFGIEWLTEDVNLDEIARELFLLVEQYNRKHLVISLSGVRMISSAGLGKFISLHRKLGRLGGAVAFCELGGAVLEVIESSRLNSYFLLRGDPAEAFLAVASEHGDGPAKTLA
jgi:anti-sigma B factor antagonist